MDGSTTTIKEDRRLLVQCIAGDREASEVFVRRFSNLIYKSVLYTLRTKHVAYTQQDLEDLHNTIFLQLFEKGCKKLMQYEGINGCSLASWIRIVAVRMVLNHVRKKGLDAITWQKRQIPFDELHDLKGGTVEPLVLMEEAEKERLLQDGIQSLPPRDRLFMKLHFDQGLPVEEVASAMRITIQNVYTLKHRAIQKLRSYVASVAK